MDNEFLDIRVFFSKTGRAKYISHLDLYRTVQRALKRAKLNVWETKGFNKHIYLTFALPLSLGIEGQRESMDLRLTSPLPFETVKDMLNKALPDEICILAVTSPQMKHTEIKKASYEVTCNCDILKLTKFLNQEKIETEKKTKKKGISVIDLKPSIKICRIENNKLTLTLPAGTEFNINPQLVTEAYKKYNPDDNNCSFSVVRTKILTANDEIFM